MLKFTFPHFGKKFFFFFSAGAYSLTELLLHQYTGIFRRSESCTYKTDIQVEKLTNPT